MRHRTALALLTVFATLALHAAPLPAQRQPAPQPPGGALGQNAALQYWQAFAHLPKVPAPGDTGPDPDEAKLVESGKDALLYLRRGASVGPCDWGLHREDGPYLLLPHLAKGRDLGRLANMKVRRDFAAGDGSEAAQTAADTLVMARHLSTDLTAIVSYLVQLAVERAAIENLSPHLGALDAATLDALDRRLAAVPPGGSIDACMKVERESFLDWAIGHLRQMNDQDPWKQKVLGPFTGDESGDEKAKVDAAVEASGGTREGVLKQFESLRSFYEQVPAITRLPRDQFRAKLADLEKQAQGNPFAALVLPTMGKVYDRDAAGRTRMTLLKAAIAVARGGPDKVREFKDAAGAPIEYQAAPDGFELRTRVLDNDKPVTLKVGGKR